MATVTAAIVRWACLSRRRSRERSGRCGGGRDRAPRPFGCCAVITACAHTSGRCSIVGPVCQRQTMSPAVIACDARGSRECGSPTSINCGRGESLTSPLSIRHPCFSPFFSAARSLGVASVCLVHVPPSSLLPVLARNGSATANHSASALASAPFDGDAICSERASQWRAAGAERGSGAPGVDCLAGVGPGAQPLPWPRSTVTPFALNELVNAAPEVLVMREDGCVMPQRPAHDAEASLSRAILPTPDAVVAHPE
jgi:hypothetical protein